jgi:hypothetical protein
MLASAEMPPSPGQRRAPCRGSHGPPDLPPDLSGFREERLGLCRITAAYVTAQRSTHMNVGDPSRDAKASSRPKTATGVGAVIVAMKQANTCGAKGGSPAG